MATFKKKPISAQAVALAEEGAASAPIVGDPRMAPLPVSTPPAADPVIPTLGSSQDRITATPGQIVHAPLSRIKSNPFNPRAVYTSAAVDELAISMQTHGQRVAALGYLDDDGYVVLIEGETRFRGARAAGIESLRIELRPKPESDRELYEMARAANVERRDQTPLDDAIRWKELLARKVYPTQSALAKALTLGEDHVSRILSLAQLPQKVIMSCSESPELLTVKMLNAIREFWEQQGDEPTIDLIREAAKEGLGYRDVASRRKAAAKGPVKRPRSTREAFVFHGAKGEFKSFEDGGRIELAIKGLTPERAEEITAKIMALFAKE
ncbi:ParB/RepB/Spo0J family partition protein [Duganella sp. BJB488]|uniref:ParB/RepB/Spo0J family partition protein n=1 Tax=unclassified Duganella TaxID=2636909 RepID=UPI000E343C98|nr:MULTISPECIES: ParB/RepB/Spo0J family partition protein [unclassified Duganella]RFP09216.1 ParB/RepB/Spo0J family partition protein [Duganella sp. BJB475]RFP13291.1 ParB/RepB/Spo0J family partition protein [Duganella sp. BJB489]RFP17133.1 ParB/RepB/Spo0J family partition protein [Duganella sp. BJB488]RFP25442.1 ParB/RepB/Spo0J family partition protein [Duganella sp. BJB476]RFP31648.1 ParB/RepB/Spo0J family partition protein [Duganella sp. BJB480]